MSADAGKVLASDYALSTDSKSMGGSHASREGQELFGLNGS